MRLGWLAALLLMSLLLVPQAAAGTSAQRAQQIRDAITELDLERARRLLGSVDQDSATLAFERARLAIYRGDCDTAAAILSTPTYSATKEGAALARLADGCAGATAGALLVRDEQRGLWVRLQDHSDRALLPFISEVAIRARAALGRDFGSELPRPLRLEVVRDVFSLSAVTGLPVDAAETTGTVAVARWGRVVMISPRAMPHGYPWQDTLAHEIAHLVLTRMSADRAPLWLQEGIAKREETRWREPRPFDELPYDQIARAALLAGQSVGIQGLGPSIAMLPSAESARIAYAEVTSFISYWIQQNGEPALRLLLADLRGMGSSDTDAAMRSVTGFELGAWEARWQQHLLSVNESVSADAAAAARAEGTGLAVPSAQSQVRTSEVLRRVRLGDLLFERGHATAAKTQFQMALTPAAKEAALRWRYARALLDARQPAEAVEQLGDLQAIDGPFGPWFALRGRFLKERGETRAAERSFALGVSFDPLSEDVACQGHWRPRGPNRRSSPHPLPRAWDMRELCRQARLFGRQD